MKILAWSLYLSVQLDGLDLRASRGTQWGLPRLVYKQIAEVHKISGSVVAMCRSVWVPEKIVFAALMVTLQKAHNLRKKKKNATKTEEEKNLFPQPLTVCDIFQLCR